MKNILAIVSIFVFCILFSSCASMFTKTSYPVTINSDPNGAKISIENRKGEIVYSGKTPAIVNLNASSKYMSGERFTVTLTKPGYEEQKIHINSEIESVYWGNIFFGGLIGMLVIDPLSGAMYKLDTETIITTLEKEDSSDLSLQR